MDSSNIVGGGFIPGDVFYLCLPHYVICNEKIKLQLMSKKNNNFATPGNPEVKGKLKYFPIAI